MDGFDYGSQSKDGSAIGVSVYVNVATHDTQAVVADTARIYSKDLNVEAGNELVSVTLGASGGQAKTVAVNGVVLVNVTSATTRWRAAPPWRPRARRRSRRATRPGSAPWPAPPPAPRPWAWA